MSTTNVNDAGYDARLEAVAQILSSYQLQHSHVETLAYTRNFPWPFNNFLFKVELAAPATLDSFPGTQPGTVQVPASGVSTLVVKLTNNNAEETNQANRVQNDVAAQWIARQSLASAGMASLMPNIYAWAAVGTDEKTSHGWVVSEFRDGVDLDTQLPSLEPAEKQAVLEQMAAILARIQQAELPKGANMFAGLAFDHDDTIVSGQAPQHMGDGKPLETYADRRITMLRASLDAASESTVVEGWRENGIKDRIETFLNEGGPAKVLEGIDLRQKGLIHGDFSSNNMLFDKETKKIVAVLDFDWAYVSHPIDEFTFSLQDVGGNIDTTESPLNQAVLSGDFTVTPEGLDEKEASKWERAMAWNLAAKKNGVTTPADVKGVEGVLELLRFQRLLAPHQLLDGSATKGLSDDDKKKQRGEAEDRISKWLEKYGY